jgi:ribosome biogenesis protein NSA1
MTVPPTEEGGPPSSMLATLPMRLKDWKLGPGARMFAYAGDEVELSVWDVGRAFSSSASNLVSMLGKDANSGQDGAQKKRKRRAGDDLLPGEVWRAKNVPNDELSLRVPVHHTSLVFLSGSTSSQNNTSEKTAGSGADVHILTGTHGGAVRRYDTRAARKPVADWKEIVKKGPVRSVQSGCREQ